MGDNIMAYNGGSVVAMVGKTHVAIASDKRFGVQAMTLSTENPKVYSMHERLFIALSGLSTDVMTLSQMLKMRCQLYSLAEEGRKIAPVAFSHLVSSTLYEKRFSPYYAEPVIAGLQPVIDEKSSNDKSSSKQQKTKLKPFICSTDLIGCINFAKDFVVAGTSSHQLYGTCEALWEPDMSKDELSECISQALLSAMDRDAVSGWGAVVYLIGEEGVTVRHLKGRMD
ncbi:hypothetical protein MIR68_000759 [Amoeboaphelidium protococcarum]|nr:hypothetical protein MIR68_000759 [Amoeboaphelidium protococcarum]